MTECMVVVCIGTRDRWDHGACARVVALAREANNDLATGAPLRARRSCMSYCDWPTSAPKLLPSLDNLDGDQIASKPTVGGTSTRPFPDGRWSGPNSKNRLVAVLRSGWSRGSNRPWAD